MVSLAGLKAKDWLLIFLVLLQVGELTAALMTFTFPWTLWAAIAAIGALLGMVAWGIQMLSWVKLPAIAVMFIGLGGALLTFLVRGAT